MTKLKQDLCNLFVEHQQFLIKTKVSLRILSREVESTCDSRLPMSLTYSSLTRNFNVQYNYVEYLRIKICEDKEPTSLDYKEIVSFIIGLELGSEKFLLRIKKDPLTNEIAFEDYKILHENYTKLKGNTSLIILELIKFY